MFYAAAQMWLLARILPIVTGDLIQSKIHKMYLVIMRISELLFTNKLHRDGVGYMAHLIELQHTNFKQLYPGESILPKMHFMLHMPKLTLK